ncbi:pyridoxamine 5'-phosphate oxidase family protein [Streptomyces sp. UNOC14_S4]|uniref:helix-turn-helix domain-containing protein n=1 Tax=Streptomyces sp. UNOC14_S4 TaxID=2872340 RepID=UPI001E377376|nr:pyridoxamine 5'-phosphate oxidase family protein [Streptomyces sp. UNOC14_S4]MCC3767649.1 pyridoxamine 5'-phosphate oxidase family protein [Streptomyces sp. UNOC14_S4]
MQGEGVPTGGAAGAAANGGDGDDGVAARASLRREQLGLSREEAASRAGMSVAYLDQLGRIGYDFDPGALMRLAAVLQMPYDELVTGRRDAPPGQGTAAAHPVLMRLAERECWERLGTHGIGRLGLSTEAGPVVLPVNFLVDGCAVVYRTEHGGPAAVAAGTLVAFEADHIDEQLSSGWSVLVTGAAEHVTDPGTIRSLSERPGARPWAGGKRDLWVRVVPGEVSGRTIRAV